MNKQLKIGVLSAVLVSSFLIGGYAKAGDGPESIRSENETRTMTSPKPTPNLACMQDAVGKRETAIMTSVDAFHSSVSAALTARKTSLIAVWTITDRTVRNTAIKTAVATYRTSLASARTAFRTARKSAWAIFTVDRRACGLPSNAHDSANAGLDATI